MSEPLINLNSARTTDGMSLYIKSREDLIWIASSEPASLLEKQLGHDTVISLATCSDGVVSVRTVNGYYKDGCIYVLTHMSSGKMSILSKIPT